ncbi:MAG TPA: hypothetical protein VF992_00815 [Thermoplasmata archaeon]
MEGASNSSNRAATARLWTSVRIAALRPWPWFVAAGIAALAVYVASVLSTATFGCIGCPAEVPPNPYNSAFVVFLIPAATFPSLAVLVFWPVLKRLTGRGAEDLSVESRLVTHLGSVLVFTIAAAITWLAYFIYAGLLTGSFLAAVYVLPLVLLTIPLGLMFQFLLEMASSVLKGQRPAGAVIVAYALLVSPPLLARSGVFSLLGPVGFLISGPPFAYYLATAAYGGNYGYVGGAGLAQAIFFGWFAVISAWWVAWARQKPKAR